LTQGNILPIGGTFKTVSAIDAIDAPYAMSWAANSEYKYDGGSPGHLGQP